jgi:hypothetical protein
MNEVLRIGHVDQSAQIFYQLLELPAHRAIAPWLLSGASK